MFFFTAFPRDMWINALATFAGHDVANLIWFVARLVNVVAWTVWGAGKAALAVARVMVWVVVYLCVSKATKRAMRRKIEKKLASIA